MNPLTNVKNINKLNEIELSKGLVDKKSWHDIYKDSAWIFIGGLSYGLTEGDILCVFSQYGEIVNVNLVRDKKTGKTKGFCFLCYANQKSTILAVDNLNGIKLCGRTIRVDHVANYKPPKDNEHDDEITKQLKEEGCAPKPIKLEKSPSPVEIKPEKKRKKSKKEKKKHKKNKKKSKDDPSVKRKKIKKEKHDPGYDKYELLQNSSETSRLAKHKKINQSESSSSDESSSDDEYSVHTNSEKQNRIEAYGRIVQENMNPQGSSGYQDSINKHESNEKGYSKKYKHKDSENYSDEEKAKRKKLRMHDLENERRYDQPSCSFHNTSQQSSSQSLSGESFDKYSSSPKRRTESNHEVSHKQRSESLSHKVKNYNDKLHGRSRHDSSSSMDNSPSRSAYNSSKDHSKHTKYLQTSHYKNGNFSPDRKYTEKPHRYSEEYRKHSSSSSYNRAKTESYERTKHSNKSHHYDSKRNKER